MQLQPQPNSLLELLASIVLYMCYGAVWNASGYMHTAAETGERWNLRKAAPAFLIGAGAGALVWATGGDIGQQNIEAAAALLIPVANECYSTFKRVRAVVEEKEAEGADTTEIATAAAMEGFESFDFDETTDATDDYRDHVDRHHDGDGLEDPSRRSFFTDLLDPDRDVSTEVEQENTNESITENADGPTVIDDNVSP